MTTTTNSTQMMFEDLEDLEIQKKPSRTLDQVAWVSKTHEIITEYKCFIPRKIIHIMKSADTVLPTDEFSFLFKSRLDVEKKTIIIDAEDWFFPNQEVSQASIEYLEDNVDYNTVIHKHPKGCTMFSQTDKNYINSNFKISILWVNDSFSMGIINIDSEVGTVQIPLKFYLEKEFKEDEEVIQTVKLKAKKKVFTSAAYINPSVGGAIGIGIKPGGGSHTTYKFDNNGKVIETHRKYGDARQAANAEFEDFMSNKYWR